MDNLNDDLDVAIEHHLHDVYQGEMSLPSIPKVHQAICLFNSGERDRRLNLPDGPMAVAKIVEEFGLTPFLSQIDQFEGAEVNKGDLVLYQRQVCRVLGRREVTPLAVLRTDEFEVYVETLDQKNAGFVSPSVAYPITLADAWKEGFLPLQTAIESHLKKNGQGPVHGMLMRSWDFVIGFANLGLMNTLVQVDDDFEMSVQEIVERYHLEEFLG